ncbi:MAG: glycerophosphodiester phosphodiesterase [Eubacteriales bacterium]|nr:glycerophosphodiester phosphodiesterase [Eubacteriales bacterium]
MKQMDGNTAGQKKETALPAIWAHRGASGHAPENTMTAFEGAVQEGADGIELDVQLSRDGALVVIHDERVDRTSDGIGFVRDMSLSELRKLNFNRNFPEYGTVRIPLLEEVLALCRTEKLFLNIELKNGIYDYPGLEEAVVKAVAGAGMEEQVIYSSFNHYSMERLRAIAPDARRGILYSDRWIGVPGYGKLLGVNALHPALWHLDDETLVRNAHDKGLSVHVWTVNETDDMKRCQRLGADAIITNFPGRCRRAVSE